MKHGVSDATGELLLMLGVATPFLVLGHSFGWKRAEHWFNLFSLGSLVLGALVLIASHRVHPSKPIRVAQIIAAALAVVGLVGLFQAPQ
jgi:hypothetical protein